MNHYRNIHEEYHSQIKRSKRIIKDKNFTYRNIISVLNSTLTHKLDVIDIGCGAGSLCFYVANKKNNTLGLDISKIAIRECIKSSREMGLKNVKFLQGEFPKVNINRKFDIVVFTEVIEHLPNDKLALNKIYNLLKKNGSLILSTPSVNAPLHKIGITRNFDKKVGHLRRYDIETLSTLIIKSGFHIIEIKKTEGILRNFLFVNSYAGKLVRFINYSELLSDFVTFIDNILLKIFGESNYIILAKKVDKNNKQEK